MTCHLYAWNFAIALLFFLNHEIVFLMESKEFGNGLYGVDLAIAPPVFMMVQSAEFSESQSGAFRLLHSLEPKETQERGHYPLEFLIFPDTVWIQGRPLIRYQYRLRSCHDPL
jgi:hypothetical protein